MSDRTAFQTYLFSYDHAGSSWVLEVKATDAEDAKARVRRLHSATFDGELVAKVAVPTMPWQRITAAFRRLALLGR